jgi:transposase
LIVEGTLLANFVRKLGARGVAWRGVPVLDLAFCMIGLRSSFLRPGRRMEPVMSVQPRPWPQPAPEIAAAVAVMYRGKRERPLPVMVRDQLGEWLSDEQFAGAYGVRGKPGWPPGRLALVTIFQMAEDLTDRQAAEAVRTRIDWKYALGLDLADPGFDDSVLSEFRTRVAGGGLDQMVLDTLLQRLAAGGLVAAGGKMRTDSTHVIAAVRDLNRLELAGESVRACLEQLVVAAPQVVAHLLDDSWGKRYAARIDTWRMPACKTKKAELALAYGRDGRTLLKAVYAAAGSEGHGGGDGEALPPPHLIVNVETTDATVPDSQMTAPVHARLTGRGLRPAEHYVDSGYPSAELLVSSLASFGITLVTPMLADTSPQARAGTGYDRAAFAIDFGTQQATCPQGHASSSWNPVTQRGTGTIVITFAKAACRPCPVRAQCTTSASGRRQLTVHPGRSTRPSSLPGPPRAPKTSRPDTRCAPAWKAPSARASPSPACAAPATAACPRPAWNTSTPRPRST